MSKVKVGILSAPEIRVRFNGGYGPETVRFSADSRGLLLDGSPVDRAEFRAASATDSFTVSDVTIGVDFHWQRRENQTFRGDCIVLLNAEGIPTLINEIDIEEYLRSVISSEMSATASLPLLKAHAVISRSWLLAQIQHAGADADTPTIETDSDNELIRWYDHSSHSLFDVCADDHCQRYQGISRQTTPTVDRAVDETAGEVLMYDGQLCDARFSKCCGGVFEEFENCWQPVHHKYLTARRDSRTPLDFPDLRRAKEAEHWIESGPDAFCNTRDSSILAQVLNGYDQETADFYRWRVSYSRQELSELIHRRSGVDFGQIIALEPLERGTSGRITRLLIRGTLRSKVIGKELEIRRTLSPSHLYSSAFTVHTSGTDAQGVPARFELHGAGWGHGVGLCQIGAAVMGALGYDYRAILGHYFPGAEIVSPTSNTNQK